MRFKKLTIAVVYILIGIIIGSFGTMSWVGIKMAKTFLFLKEVELGKSGSMAWERYNSGNPSIAIWALQQHLKNLGEWSKIMEDPEIDWPYKDNIEIELIITHGRLAKLYKDTGQTEGKEVHLKEALSISQSSDKPAFNCLSNEALLFDKVAVFDKYLYPR